jgi:hypothetical protein
LKTFEGALALQGTHANGLGVEICNPTTVSTYQVIVLGLVGFHSKGTVMHAHFPQHPALQEGTDVFIHRCVSVGGYLFWHSLVDNLRSGMPFQRHNRFVDNSPLMGSRELVLATEGCKVSSTYHTIIVIKQ